MKILLLDDHWPQTIWLIAEMYRQKIDVVYASPGAVSARGLGRYCRHRRSLWMHDPKYRDFLMQLLREEPFDLILPLCEPLQRIAWALPEPFVSKVFPKATHEQRRLLADRRAIYPFAASIGVPVPRMLSISGPEDLDPIARDLGWPLVLRGTQGLGGQQVRIVRNVEALRESYDQLRDRSPELPFAQAFITGVRTAVGSLLDHGTPLRLIAQEALETYPGPTGPPIRVRSTSDAILIDYAKRLFAALRWHGLAQAEFIQGQDGQRYFLEINPRPWGSIICAEACRARLFRSFVHLLKGVTVEPDLRYVTDREVAIFPSFLAARLREGRFPRLGDWASYRRMAATIPWRQFGLLHHTAQQLYWLWDAGRRQRAPS